MVEKKSGKVIAYEGVLMIYHSRNIKAVKT